MKPSDLQDLREDVEKALYDWDEGEYDDASEALEQLEEYQRRLPESESALHSRLESTLIQAAETIDDYQYDPEGG